MLTTCLKSTSNTSKSRISSRRLEKMNVTHTSFQTMRSIVVLISGNGSNLQAIIDATKNSTLPNARVSVVISNKPDAYGLERAKVAGVLTETWVPQAGRKREEYDENLATHIKTDFNPDLIVLAGWMRILTKEFINTFPAGTIINIHPALPGQFPGADGIGDALAAYKAKKITKTGLMIHEVIPEMDAGRVLETETVEILPNDTLNSLTQRVQAKEKLALINAIYKKLQTPSELTNVVPYIGKVRQMYDLGFGVVAMEHSDRLSAFDRNICNVPGKGRFLLELSKWWFERTRMIIPNHFIHSDANVMFVRKCTPIRLEVIVRGYITGSTQTSLWTHYAAGSREYCGHHFVDGLRKNQKLDRNIVTPTTKGDVDELIDTKTILERGMLPKEDWEYIQSKALELFAHGQQMAAARGLILVDTKYEFGYDEYGVITLIDEIHTADSSRYWIASSYDQRVAAGQEPEKYDKDVVRDYLKLSLKWNAYEVDSVVPVIPQELLTKTIAAYAALNHILMGGPGVDHDTFKVYTPFDVVVEDYFRRVHSPTVLVIAGSTSDAEHVKKITTAAAKLGLYSRIVYASAHKNPETVLGYLKEHNQRSRKAVWITVAGRSNALGGFVAANSVLPTIVCPPFSDKSDYLVNIHSSLQMPSDTPAMIVLDPANAALAAKRILQ